MPRTRLAFAGVLLVAAAAAGSWWFLAGGKMRRLVLGHSIEVRFAFSQPAAVIVQRRGRDLAWLPYCYAILGDGSGADMVLSGELDEAMVTIGVGGTLHDKANDTDRTDAAGTLMFGRLDQEFEIRGAAPMASIQTVKGTRLTVGIENGTLVSSPDPLERR